MSAFDTFRWGDQEALNFISEPSAVPLDFGTTKQLSQARWRWPLTWCVQLIMQPALAPGEGGTFTCRWLMTIGVGQGTSTYELDYTFAPGAGGIYSPQVDQKFIPAENLQIQANLRGAPTLGAVTEGFVLGSYCAPFTEPHAMTHLLEHATGQPSDQAPGHDHERWIPDGFREGQLRYQGR